jgi:sugar phosphate isomerase/epimerase
MTPRIAVSGICTMRQSLVEDVAFWTRHGISEVGIPRGKLTRAGVEAGIELVTGAGLHVTSLLGFGPDLGDASTWPAARHDLRAMVAEAQAIGAESVVITTGPARHLRWEQAADALGEVLGPVLDEADVPVLVEHTNQLRTDISFVHSLRDVVDLARQLGVGVVMEVNACWMERALPETLARGLDVIGLVQVSDTMPGVRTTPDRAVPGDGIIPLERVLGDVRRAGYAGAFELEFIGPSIEEEGYDSAVPRARAALERILGSDHAATA